MFILPIQSPNHEHDALVVILDKTSLDRMRQADPAETAIPPKVLLVNPAVLICYEEDQPRLKALLETKDLKAILDYLRRGWQFHPELGDHDRGPESLDGPN